MSQDSKRRPNENFPRTFSAHTSVNSSFIQAFFDEATTQRLLNSSLRAFDSRFAPPNTIIGGGVYWKGEFIRGGAFISKTEILGGRSFEGALIRGGAFIRGNTVCFVDFQNGTAGLCVNNSISKDMK